MKKILFLFSVLISTQTISAQNELETRLISKTKDFIEQKMASDNIVGMSAALIINDSIIWENGFGYSDLENKRRMTEQTVVHIGSVTKPITALCAMQLHEQGLIDINEPVTKYLPQFNPKNQFGDNKDITIKHLITHSAGLQADVWKNSDLYSGKYTDVVDFTNDTHLLYPPGQFGFYSNLGYNILGHIIKEVSGLDYVDYVQKHIFEPLEMKQSGFFMDSLSNTTKLYNRKSESIKEYPIRDIASGGIYCSIHDFALLAKGIINSYHDQSPSILKSATMKETFTIQNGDAEYVVGKNKRGLGWYIFENKNALAINHTGSAGYAFAHLMIFPKDKAATLILTNSPNGRNTAEYAGYNLLEDFKLKIADVFLDPILNNDRDDFTDNKIASSDKLLHFTGNYSETTSYTKVYLENDTLRLNRNNKAVKLIPISETAFTVIDENGNRLENTRYYFKNMGSFLFLILKSNSTESVLGYKFDTVIKEKWEDKLGNYDHYGYQLLAGDSKFKSINLKITDDDVLITVLKTLDNTEYRLPIDMISTEYGKTAGLFSGFGMTVKFLENENYYIINFAGITFRKSK